MHANRVEVLLRGFRMICPKCGQGHLFSGYLTPHKACCHCHEDFRNLRADDGPAWLTVLVLGHIIVPLVLALYQADVLTSLVELISFAIVMSVIGVVVLLPRAKGVFMALLWLFAQTKEIG